MHPTRVPGMWAFGGYDSELHALAWLVDRDYQPWLRPGVSRIGVLRLQPHIDGTRSPMFNSFCERKTGRWHSFAARDNHDSECDLVPRLVLLVGAIDKISGSGVSPGGQK